MKILKLLHCFWKLPIMKNEHKFVTYYLQYERENYNGYAKYVNYGEFKILINHEDEIDQGISNELSSEILKLPGIKEFGICPHETYLYNEFEEKNRAIFSNLAYGYPFRYLQINTLTDPIARLSTRIMFVGIRDEDYRNSIFPTIPYALNLKFNGKIPTLTQSLFMPHDKVQEVLKDNFDLDFEEL